MSHIKRRKHQPSRQPRLHQGTALTLIAMTLPGVALAQQTLPEVNVKSTVEASTYKANTVSSPKFTEPLVDTTQTITVIKKEVLQEQGATTLIEALRNTPGITLTLGEGGNSNQKDNIVMRGFDTSGNVFVDNVRELGSFPRDTFNIEQVEISKGPVGADNGRGAPSGYINLSSKAPLADNFVGGSIGYSDAETVRLTADLNRKLTETSAFRLNLMHQDGGVAGRDEVESKRLGIAPSIAFGLNTPTRLVFSLLHVEQDNVPDGGVPTVGLKGYYNASLAGAGITAAKVDRENFYGSTSDYEDIVGDMFTARIEHDLTPDITVRNTTRYAKLRHEFVLTAPSGSFTAATAIAPPSTWTASRSRQTRWQDNELLTNQTNVTAAFETGPLKHSLSGGIEFIYERQLQKTLTAGTMAAANLYNPDPHDPVTGSPTFSGARTDGDTKTLGVYLFDTIKLGERWQINGGVRWDRYTTDYESIAAGTGVATRLDASDTLFGYKVGALYKPADNGSVYVAYSTSQQPPGGANFQLNSGAANIANPNMDPQEATNLELGTKWEFFDNQLAVNAAIFRSENKNELANTDAATGEVTQYGKKRVEGIELGIVGAITPAWQISAGLAKMKTKIVEGTTGTNASDGATLNWSPELTFTAWTTYKFPFGLTLGAGARYVDSMVRSANSQQNATNQNMMKVDDYWVYDAMASYAINKSVSLQLNVYNLTDEKYITNLNNNGNRYTPGAPRSAMLSANFLF